MTETRRRWQARIGSLKAWALLIGVFVAIWIWNLVLTLRTSLRDPTEPMSTQAGLLLGIAGLFLNPFLILIAAFVWQSPTRLIRAQVLSMRESGYVQMARLSGASTGHIMFREMLPNLVPYLFGSFIANVTTSIVTAVGLEVLGLGPQRIPTLGRVIYDAINSGALIQNLWWWWGIPTLLLAVMFIGLLLINLGLDEVSNPRLRRLS